ncbi:MAG: hypothetical protein ACSNEK_03455 [Parachlamydiaceae bacterium]
MDTQAEKSKRRALFAIAARVFAVAALKLRFHRRSIDCIGSRFSAWRFGAGGFCFPSLLLYLLRPIYLIKMLITT